MRVHVLPGSPNPFINQPRIQNQRFWACWPHNKDTAGSLSLKLEIIVVTWATIDPDTVCNSTVILMLNIKMCNLNIRKPKSVESSSNSNLVF